MMLLANPFVPYEQLDLDIILKVTAAIYYLSLADLNCGTYLPPGKKIISHYICPSCHKQVIKLFWVYYCLPL